MVRKYGKKFLLEAFILAVVSTSSAAWAFAANHQELNGTWQLVPARSELNGEPAIQTGTVTINDREGNIYVQRNFNFESADLSTSSSFSTDARHKASIKDKGAEFKSKAKWEGDSLKVVTVQGPVTINERYGLSADGAMMLQIERTGHQPETLYFQRK